MKLHTQPDECCVHNVLKIFLKYRQFYYTVLFSETPGISHIFDAFTDDASGKWAKTNEFRGQAGVTTLNPKFSVPVSFRWMHLWMDFFAYAVYYNSHPR